MDSRYCERNKTFLVQVRLSLFSSSSDFLSSPGDESGRGGGGGRGGGREEGRWGAPPLRWAPWAPPPWWSSSSTRPQPQEQDWRGRVEHWEKKSIMPKTAKKCNINMWLAYMFRTLGTPLTHLYEKVMKIIFYASLIPNPYPHRCVREINDCFAECTPLNTWLFFRIPLRGRPRESLQTTGRRLMPLPLQQKLALNLFMETDLSLARRETGGKENWKEKLETKIPGLNSSVRTSWATVWLRTRWGGGCEKVEKVPWENWV